MDLKNWDRSRIDGTKRSFELIKLWRLCDDNPMLYMLGKLYSPKHQGLNMHLYLGVNLNLEIR